VKKIREIAGPTNPHVAREKAPGTIRTLGTVVPVKDESGASIGDRIDNLVHASATPEEAEREVKLWFKPNDIMPYRHAYPTATADALYYYRDGRLLASYEPGSTCLMAPGDTVWQSDLDGLRALAQSKAAPLSLEAIAAKYLINEKRET
jgi:nucleoside-diphosphate kinase